MHFQVQVWAQSARFSSRYNDIVTKNGVQQSGWYIKIENYSSRALAEVCWEAVVNLHCVSTSVWEMPEQVRANGKEKREIVAGISLFGLWYCLRVDLFALEYFVLWHISGCMLIISLQTLKRWNFYIHSVGVAL